MNANSSSNTISSTPPFPELGSILSGRYFCLGRLGRGTFCSIHQCIDLSHHHTIPFNEKKEKTSKSHLVAAKVELTQFSNSGVVDGEATILSHLSTHLPSQSVPAYHDHVKIGDLSAIVMEYLPGEDMHQLRERHCTLLTQMHQEEQQKQKLEILKNNKNSNDSQSASTSTSPPISSTKCRVNLQDAVYLTADCMIPLLQQMHHAGVIHRDVKPNNCVRTGTTEKDKKFKMVDFGLSKSFVVPITSSLADLDYPWTSLRPWHNMSSSSNSNNFNHPNSCKDEKPCLRKERPTADFRGTSMYASLRVHQSNDYGRRDDIWGLLYVFCDLVSGGLPWMKQAGERDREMCKKMKEFVHGEGNELMQPEDIRSPKMDEDGNVSEPEEGEEIIYRDHIEDLLKGAAHHLAKQKKKLNPNIIVPPPLAMSADGRRVEHLRKAFQHVSKLSFQDEPDYAFIQKCLYGFLPSKDDPQNVRDEDAQLPEIDWNMSSSSRTNRSQNSVSKLSNSSHSESTLTTEAMDRIWPQRYTTKDDSVSQPDAVTPLLLEDAEQERLTQQAQSTANSNNSNNSSSNSNSSPTGSEHSLPMPLQFYLAQVEYNARNASSIPKPMALNHWMQLGFSILFLKWSMKYEKGRRNDGDGYRREEFIKVLKRCMEAAVPFQKFQSPEYFDFEYNCNLSTLSNTSLKNKGDKGEDISVEYDSKRRRLSAVSVIWCGLRGALEQEEEKKFAPPPAISFSGAMTNSS